jgi:hypothetical protein
MAKKVEPDKVTPKAPPKGKAPPPPPEPEPHVPTPLERAEEAHAAYETDPSGSNYNLWKQYELEHLTS